MRAGAQRGADGRGAGHHVGRGRVWPARERLRLRLGNARGRTGHLQRGVGDCGGPPHAGALRDERPGQGRKGRRERRRRGRRPLQAQEQGAPGGRGGGPSRPPAAAQIRTLWKGRPVEASGGLHRGRGRPAHGPARAHQGQRDVGLGLERLWGAGHGRRAAAPRTGSLRGDASSFHLGDRGGAPPHPCAQHGVRRACQGGHPAPTREELRAVLQANGRRLP
mmetsp:Transcript_6560/g.15072  ORF Transcript_6560/g.15072 Transcript_6560/m.15072 type:complete len:221 (+) Transcript_6560:908-1570(+)